MPLDVDLQLAIEQLHARYAHALDEDRLEAWPDFFAPAGSYRIVTAENHAAGLPLPLLYVNSRAMMRDRVASLRHANVYEPQRYRHLVSGVLLERLDPEHVSSIAAFVVLRILQDGDTIVFASGRYLDRILVTGEDGAPQYEERVVVCDSRRFDTQLAIPL